MLIRAVGLKRPADKDGTESSNRSRSLGREIAALIEV